MEIALLVLAMVLRVVVIAFMYNIFIELYKARECILSYLFIAGFGFYSAYTFGISIGQDLDNPIRIIALFGLSIMLGVTFKFIRKTRKQN